MGSSRHTGLRRGIPAPDLERIFEPYYRGSNVPGSISGTGVGLAGTRHIVEQHDCEIHMDSVVGEGTVSLCAYR